MIKITTRDAFFNAHCDVLIQICQNIFLKSNTDFDIQIELDKPKELVGVMFCLEKSTFNGSVSVEASWRRKGETFSMQEIRDGKLKEKFSIKKIDDLGALPSELQDFEDQGEKILICPSRSGGLSIIYLKLED